MKALAVSYVCANCHREFDHSYRDRGDGCIAMPRDLHCATCGQVMMHTVPELVEVDDE